MDEGKVERFRGSARVEQVSVKTRSGLESRFPMSLYVTASAILTISQTTIAGLYRGLKSSRRAKNIEGQ
jgi:hypothetical protein